MAVEDLTKEKTQANPRGIQNPRKITSNNKRRGPVEEKFLKEQSLSAQVERKKQQRIGGELGEGAEGAREAELEEIQRKERLERLAEEHAQAAVKRKIQSGKIAAFSKKKAAHKLSAFARWAGLSSVFTIYIWQLLFAVISLVCFALMAYISYAEDETWTGWFISVFVDFHEYLPVYYVAWGSWAIVAALSIGVFLAYLIWYYFIGIKPFGDIVSFLVTVICFTLSLLPVTNIFPWLILWILYMDVSSLFLTH